MTEENDLIDFIKQVTRDIEKRTESIKEANRRFRIEFTGVRPVTWEDIDRGVSIPVVVTTLAEASKIMNDVAELYRNAGMEPPAMEILEQESIWKESKKVQPSSSIASS